MITYRLIQFIDKFIKFPFYLIIIQTLTNDRIAFCGKPNLELRFIFGLAFESVRAPHTIVRIKLQYIQAPYATSNNHNAPE